MSIKRIFIVISAIFAVSAVFADNSSVTSKKYVDDLMSGYQGKLPGSGANTLMIYDDEDGIGEKAIAATLGNSASATSVPTVGAVKTGLDGKQDTITGTAGYVMTGTGNAGEVGERAIYGTVVYSNSLVTAETVNTGVTDAVNSSLIRVDENGAPSDTGTLWEINTDVFALGVLPSGYTQLEWIESDGTQYIDTGIPSNSNMQTEVSFSPTGWGGAVFGNYSDNDLAQNSNTLYISPQASGYLYTTDYGAELDGNINRTKIGDISLGTVYNVTIDWKNRRGIFDNTVIPFVSQEVWQGTTNQVLFARTSGAAGTVGYYGKLKLYYAKLWDNGTLVRDFVPCKNASNVVGIYDTVTGQFFTNQGNGDFIAGPPVAGN